jgi:hypothetical protein
MHLVIESGGHTFVFSYMPLEPIDVFRAITGQSSSIKKEVLSYFSKLPEGYELSEAFSRAYSKGYANPDSLNPYTPPGKEWCDYMMGAIDADRRELPRLEVCPLATVYGY